MDDDVPTDEDWRLVDSNMKVKSSKDNSDVGGITPNVEKKYY